MEFRPLSIKTTAQYMLEIPPVYDGPLSKVYRAQDLELKRTVGIKEVDYKNLPPKERNTLLSEISVWCDYATRTARMPQIYNVLSDGTKYYIIMQWIDGKTLRNYLEEGNLSFTQKMDYAIQLCEALSPIHKNRKQHRDLKPENLQIGKNGRLYLMDFNISAAVPHTGVGTDGYLAPECNGLSQQSGAVRVDVFAIGVILYEMFTGSIPIFGLDYICMPEDKKWQMFVKPSEKNNSIPQALDAIICRCMALQWKDRYPDAGSIARELKSIRDRRSR